MANPNEPVAQQSPVHSKVIIAVNTSHGIGYFVDSEGNKLFNKLFDGVSGFSEGLAHVMQNDKWGFINTKGEVVIPCVYDDAGDEFATVNEMDETYGFFAISLRSKKK